MTGHVDGARPIVIHRGRPASPARRTAAAGTSIAARTASELEAAAPEVSAVVDEILAELRTDAAPYRFPAPAVYARPQHARPRRRARSLRKWLGRIVDRLLDGLALAVAAVFCAMFAVVLVSWWAPGTTAGISL